MSQTPWFGLLPAYARNWIERHPNLRKILANAGWLFADKVFRMGVGLFVGIWVARYLGPEQFGQLNFAIAFVSLFGAIASLGVDAIVVRDLVRHPQRKEEILGSAFALKLTGGSIAFAAAQAVIWLLRPADNLVHWLVGIIAAGMIFQAFDVIDFWFQSQVKSKFTVYARDAAFTVLSVVKVVLILNGAELIAFAWAALAEIVLSAIGLAIVFAKVVQPRGSGQIRWVTMRALVVESWPLLLSGMAIMLYVRIDQIMLAEMIGEREVGLYAAAIRLSEVWYLVPGIIVSSVMPSITEMRARSRELYYQRLQQLFIYLARSAYIVAIPTTLLADPIIRLLYGDPYSQAGPILTVHIWAAMFVFMGVARGIHAINEGLNRIVLLGTVCGAALNIILNIILIPQYGALGAAIATTISYGCSDILFYRFVPSFEPIYKMMLSAVTLGMVKRR